MHVNGCEEPERLGLRLERVQHGTGYQMRVQGVMGKHEGPGPEGEGELASQKPGMPGRRSYMTAVRIVSMLLEAS